MVETTFETEGRRGLLDRLYASAGEALACVRMVRGVRGRVAMQMDLAIRFDYGRTIPWVTSKDQELRAVAGDGHGGAADQGPAARRGHDDTERDSRCARAETVSFTLTNSSSLEKAAGGACRRKRRCKRTQRFWKRVEREEQI